GSELTSLSRAELAQRFESLAVQCLRALDYIHSRNLLHNDIKPQNIMVHPPFQVKLLDFGLARPQTDSAEPGLSGTIHYVAPARPAAHSRGRPVCGGLHPLPSPEPPQQKKKPRKTSGPPRRSR